MNRMKLWRLRKTSQEAGRQTQVCVWAPEHDAELVRQICTRVAEATARGSELRSVLHPQVARRRTTATQWAGTGFQVEVDYPLVGPWWFMRNIGGRITGSDDTHIELSPEEAHDLKVRLSQICEKEIRSWLTSRKLLGTVRDNTGVVTDEDYVDHTLSADPNRPADETAFAENEARIAKGVREAARRSRKPPVKDPSVIEFEGDQGFPSFCQIAHRKQGERIQFALIHMNNGGTSPTNMFAPLATYMRQRFYPEIDAGRIDWYDVIPAGVYHRPTTDILPVRMEHANGIYSKPQWSGDRAPDIPKDWAAFIDETVALGQAARGSSEIPSRVDTGKKKLVALE